MEGDFLGPSLVGADDGSPDDITVPRDVLGGGVKNIIGSPFQRPLKNRGGECVVHGEFGSDFFRAGNRPFQ